MTKLELRLRYLEKLMSDRITKNIWIDMKDTIVRIDINGKRGKEIIFDSVFKASKWVETQMNESEKISGTAWITDISQLWNDHSLQKRFRETWINEPMPVLLNLSRIPTICFKKVALDSCIFACFSTDAFNERFFSLELTEEDLCAMEALSLLYNYEKPGDPEALSMEFAKYISEISKLFSYSPNRKINLTLENLLNYF